MGAYTDGRVGRCGLASVFTLFFFSLGFAIVTPAMGKFAEAFPDEEYALINSLPTLFVGIAGLLLGPLAGKRMKFRTLAVIGSLLSLIGGITPAFLDGFAPILVCRAVTGFGLGLLIPMANALVNGNFEGERRATLLSMGSLLLNAGGIILQFLGGLLADMDWHATFYAYALFAVAVVMSFFIPEAETADGGTGEKLNRGIAAVAALFVIYGMLQFSVMQNTAELFESRNAGGATVSGLALSLFTLAGCVGGAAYAGIRKKRPGLVFPTLYAFSAAGLVIEAMSDGAAGMFAGLVLFGIGFGLIIPAFMDWTGVLCSAATLSAGTAIVASSMYFGDFLSMGWKSFQEIVFGEHIVNNLWVMTAVCCVLTVVFLFFNPFGKTQGED